MSRLMYCICTAYLLGVAVLELDSHPDHNKELNPLYFVKIEITGGKV